MSFRIMYLVKIICQIFGQYKNISSQIKEETKRKYIIKSKSIAKRCTLKRKNNCVMFKIELR